MAASEKVWEPSEETIGILEKESVTPLEVCTVLTECFIYAHGDKVQAIYILKNQANKVGLSLERPDKEGILRVIPQLAEVAKDFRSPQIIEKNKRKIEGLIRKCENSCDE